VACTNVLPSVHRSTAGCTKTVELIELVLEGTQHSTTLCCQIVGSRVLMQK